MAGCGHTGRATQSVRLRVRDVETGMLDHHDDVAALTALFREHHLSLVRTAYLIVGDLPSAEDVVQDAFTGLHRRMELLESKEDLLPYVRAAVVNGCRSTLRKRRLPLRIAHEPTVWSAESAAMVSEERREVFTAVCGLPQRQREALVLRFYLGLNEAEIAAAMRIGRGTVKSTTSRALAALARALTEEL